MGSAEVIVGIGLRDLEQALVGRTIREGCRKGKQMWIAFDEGPSLLLHLGKPPASSCCINGGGESALIFPGLLRSHNVAIRSPSTIVMLFHALF